MAQAKPTTKSVPTLVEELWQLVVTYFKQETVEPLKGLVRFVGWGLAGSFLLGIGVVLLVIGGLRVLQVETSSALTGNLSWLPYLITAGACLLIIGLAIWRVGKGQPGGAK